MTDNIIKIYKVICDTLKNDFFFSTHPYFKIFSSIIIFIENIKKNKKICIKFIVKSEENKK